ncbi:hypothetical protein BCR41DRAFT_401739 [Lobosporangium transversale]|uniref:Uncharacterized protein n=1 Tax=Lobosporangium transversale TaxID=64571 RepID=A0A1Y2G8T0_9FUNG|nr:hypothetical protein BCR41DRAFT_401739 [Lobosporangium transversale]ORY99609.1 hypothetical protein BCR41DRAFT_401739 [Lobosporangium transversale]|eukprot:XP_021875904.1 hypothetical protein BCR41DRAFT_401739 [Lobosporangium transversale]
MSTSIASSAMISPQSSALHQTTSATTTTTATTTNSNNGDHSSNSSSNSNSNGSSSGAHPNNYFQHYPVPNFQVQQDSIPSLVSKRSATWRYMQRVHQGGMVLYNTAMLSEMDLRRGYADEKNHRRALQYFLLGTSLATVLEIPNVGDCLRALQVVIQEYEYFTASESRSKMMFLKATGRKVLSDVKSFEETGEYSLLEVRQLPFSLDYVITFASLCDMIAQVYEKLGTEDRPWTLTNAEIFQKIDNRFKKILTVVSKELETMAKEIMVGELNAMDPLGTSTNDHDWDL